MCVCAGEVAVVGEAGGEESHHLRRRDKLKVRTLAYTTLASRSDCYYTYFVQQYCYY